MCGIAGYIGPRPIAPERVVACEALMRRRGPDANGRYASDRNGRHVLLLHSRLSIIDLEARANQPFREGTKLIAFNGEIYNYVENRSALIARGERFHTKSDTEVLAKLLRHGGPDALDRCEGMWAFAYYDERDGSLLLSRDRFGEKPLYLMRADGGVYFGSEIKFIKALAGRSLSVNVDHLRRYLVNGYKALYKQPATFFREVRELPSGTVLAISADGNERSARFWSPPPIRQEPIGFEDAVVSVRGALIEAVRIRLRADAPLAFCMSGGVDSNALIAMAKRMFNYDVHGFTILNTHERYEEQELVEQAVRELDIKHTAVKLSKDRFLDDLRELVRAHDAPVYTISYFVHWRLMREIARAGYKVSISGSGADELFTGYYDHHNLYLAAIAADPEQHATALAAWTAHVKPLVRNPFLADPDLFRGAPKFRGHIYLNADQFSASLTEPWSESFFETHYCDDNLRNRMLNELFHEAVPPILHEDDLNAMYFSIENRSPFLDRRLFETVARIPTCHLMQNGYAKALLREAIRGIAPTAIVDCRRKVGFNAPLFDLLDNNDAMLRDELLAESPIYDIVQRNVVAHYLRQSDLPNSENKFLFNVLNAKMFLEAQCKF
jgi:asparagine synthase (glutamine-hydrolysing)